jgi:two-component system, chemotaxis family, sensor kinase CheA
LNIREHLYFNEIERKIEGIGHCMKLKNVLILGIGGLIILLMTVAITGVFQMKKLDDNMTEMVGDRYQKVNLANKIPIQLGDVSRGLRELLLTDNKTVIMKDIENINNVNTEILRTISTLLEISQKNEVGSVAQLRADYEGYLDYEKQSILLIQSGKTEEAKNYILNSSAVHLTKLIKSVNDVSAMEEELMNSSLKESQEVFDKGIVIFTFIIICGFVFGMIICMWILKAFIGNLSELTHAMEKISSFPDKTSLPRLETSSKNELGMLAEVFNSMANDLEIHARQEGESTMALKEQFWLQSKVAETHALFHGIQDMGNFCSVLIKWVCQVVEASYGNFYICSTEKGNQKLVKMSSYAAGGQDVGNDEFTPGEGLVGQCLLENRIINLTGTSDQYIEITTGLGKITSKHIKLLPVEFENKVVAVIELASLLEFTLTQREFLEQVRWNIGIIQNRIKEQSKVQKLLVESQTLTEELQTQSELLQTQQEELRTFHEKVEEQYTESELKNVQLLRAKKSLEEQALQLESNSRYKSEFLSNMSHELRTPLNSLLILARMLWENNDKNLSAKQVEYAKTIWSSGDDLLNLINQVLDLSKIEAGKVSINPENIILPELARELERQFQPISVEKQLEFIIRVDENLKDIIITDRYLLKQVLNNLLSNALKFTDRGYVRLDIQEAFGVENEHKLIAFCVSDTGIGIHKDKQSLIFEAFQQEDGTTSRKYGGTGLGLSICRELATLLGGYIGLYSIEGEGSKFTLYLPVNKDQSSPRSPGLDQISVNGFNIANQNETEQITVDSGDLAGRVVLVVDDDMRNIFAISSALENRKIKVLFAEDGKEALQKIKANLDIDLILMDIMMPELDGYETMKLIRQMPEHKNIPIIVLTAKAMKDDREKCLEAGASDYISKPLDVDKLISLIRVWLYR